MNYIFFRCMFLSLINTKIMCISFRFILFTFINMKINDILFSFRLFSFINMRHLNELQKLMRNKEIHITPSAQESGDCNHKQNTRIEKLTHYSTLLAHMKK